LDWLGAKSWPAAASPSWTAVPLAGQALTLEIILGCSSITHAPPCLPAVPGNFGMGAALKSSTWNTRPDTTVGCALLQDKTVDKSAARARSTSHGGRGGASSHRRQTCRAWHGRSCFGATSNRRQSLLTRPCYSRRPPNTRIRTHRSRICRYAQKHCGEQSFRCADRRAL
jgi:hypothetical protein